jgi:hypothetical protein
MCLSTVLTHTCSIMLRAEVQGAPTFGAGRFMDILRLAYRLNHFILYILYYIDNKGLGGLARSPGSANLTSLPQQTSGFVGLTYSWRQTIRRFRLVTAVSCGNGKVNDKKGISGARRGALVSTRQRKRNPCL